LFFLCGVATAVALLIACVSDSGNNVIVEADGAPTSDGATTTDAATADGGGATNDARPMVTPGVLSVTPSSLRIARGGTASIKIDLALKSLTEPVTIDLVGLPSGVGIAVDGGASDAGGATVTFAGGATSATVVLAASSTAAEGPTSFTLAALNVPNTAAPAAVSVPLVVAGPSGDPDTSFNFGAGVVNIAPPLGDTTSTAAAVAVMPDRGILVGGSLTGTAHSGWALVRFNENGIPDTTFGAALTDAGIGATLPTYGEVVDIAVAADGHIFVLGSVWTGPNGTGVETAAILSLRADGSRDEAFGNNGLYAWNTLNQFSGGTTPLSVAVDGTGGVYFIAYLTGSVDPNIKSLVAHLSGTGATLLSQVTDGYDVHALAVGSAGAYYAGTDVNATTSTVFGASGTNPAFTAYVGPSTGMSFSGGNVADGFLDNAGAFLFVGSNVGINNNQLFMARVTADGGLPDGGVSGTAFIAAPGGANNAPLIRRGAMQSDGKLVVVGSGDTANFNWTYIARYGVDGNIDSSFASSGVFEDRIMKPPSVNETFNDVAVDSLGRIIAVGWLSGSGWHLVRLWP
jgi:uncharacterized delta-60 repeat protein